MQAALGRSSSCRHVNALLHAYEALAHSTGAPTWAELFSTFRTSLGPNDRDDSAGEPASTNTCHSMSAGRRQSVSIFAVLYDGAWTAAAFRPSRNKVEVAICCHLSCESRPWGCIHAKAVNKMPRVDAASKAVYAEMSREDALPLGPGGMLNEQLMAAAAPGAALPHADERYPFNTLLRGATGW